ncbi:hypothetical protein [Methylobacterium sp. 285MFTsu5.1]|uniref:hypothetical protein n=1 Tax=Methylobacterium sp. 285MFTsu5.1 TaxID=1172187 RepID=UPI001319FB87|nr:hypothetical protein [Methylobacterium sp. 285MFTsu5.1]
MKIYIACGLTHVPRHEFTSYVQLIHALAQDLRDSGHSVKYALVDSDPQLEEKPFEDRAKLCYLWDREMVSDADLVVGEASYPSIGLGIELQVAEAAGTPAMLIFRRDPILRADSVRYENPDHSVHGLQVGEGYVSLMALGLPNVVTVFGYEEADEARRLLRDAVGRLASQ